MKKLISIIALACILLTLLAMALTLVSCEAIESNYQYVDLNYKFDYAYIAYGDGTVKKVEVASWRDYEEGDQLQITGKDGSVYLVHSENCVLVKEGK